MVGLQWLLWPDGAIEHVDSSKVGINQKGFRFGGATIHFCVTGFSGVAFVSTCAFAAVWRVSAAPLSYEPRCRLAGSSRRL